MEAPYTKYDFVSDLDSKHGAARHTGRSTRREEPGENIQLTGHHTVIQEEEILEEVRRRPEDVDLVGEGNVAIEEE